MKTICALLIVLFVESLFAAQARKETLDGVRNYTVVDGTVGCAGATEVTAIPAIASRGYGTVVNLRLASEPGAALEKFAIDYAAERR